MLPAPGFTTVSPAQKKILLSNRTEEDILSLGVQQGKRIPVRAEDPCGVGAEPIAAAAVLLRHFCFPGTGLRPRQGLGGLREMERPIATRSADLVGFAWRG